MGEGGGARLINAQFALSMQAKFTITKLDGEVNLLECEGIGLENKNL